MNITSEQEKILLTLNSPALFTLVGCPHCHIAKLALQKADFAYEEVSWNGGEGEKIIDSLGFKTVPVLYVKDENGLHLFDGEGEIKEFLAKRN